MFHEAFSWEVRTACGKMVRKGEIMVGQQRLPSNWEEQFYYTTAR
jgi:hypothetical protein